MGGTAQSEEDRTLGSGFSTPLGTVWGLRRISEFSDLVRTQETERCFLIILRVRLLLEAQLGESDSHCLKAGPISVREPASQFLIFVVHLVPTPYQKEFRHPRDGYV